MSLSTSTTSRFNKLLTAHPGRKSASKILTVCKIQLGFCARLTHQAALLKIR